MHKPNQDPGDPSALLRAIASRYDDVQEGPMFWCPGFFMGTTMIAGVYDNQILQCAKKKIVSTRSMQSRTVQRAAVQPYWPSDVQY